MVKQSKLLQKVNNALASGQYANAIAQLNKLIAEDSKNIEYLMLMGESLMRNEQFFDAVQYFAKIVELDSKNIRSLNNLGAGLIRIRQLENP